MPRRHRRQPPRTRSGTPPRDLPRDGAVFFGTQRVRGPGWAAGEEYLMRRMGASSARKFYVCPGCHQNIPPGVAHVVAWPDTSRGAEDRRHWHTGCWERR
ncbi:hypothetical protein [Corynebacterium bovis]|uniref:ATP/GTP-binding protein n=1 Tax=Corynebacterium bovis TaxID=36808 RepID=A0A426Q6N8_9CORY|nr:hypothetical protein [Corynebacterium bovis]RRO92439.1 hypothetical protein CXF40_03660 [Corynebacterium bovis]RRO96070.1 hypothetical protein CXF32_06585 [Corynebacterium bovis]RRO97512.1 hypothetical protein CXF31_06135 [Corynebacterium bovis]RRO99411.1 hypothetical protein CXF41_09635 [Corynebacterium bovis]RRQ04460.1 hypothetical protein CXF39_01860 [Corynebacterium bovis]